MRQTVRAGSAPERHRSRWPWLLWLVAVSSGALWWALYQSTWFTVDSVRVTGNTRVSAQDVAARAAVTAGVPLISVDIDTITSEVATFPQVAAVRVERAWPHTVLITVVEREPVAVARNAAGFTVVDDTGTAAAAPTAAPPKGMVVIEGKPGSAAMAAAVAVLAAVPGEWHVTGLVAPTQDSVEVHLRGGATVRFGSGQDAAKKVLVASALLANGYTQVNVSAPDTPTVK